MSVAIDITGQRFGRLVAIESIHGHGQLRWKCQCDCGKTVVVKSQSLRTGMTKSCGCYNVDVHKMMRKNITGEKFGRLTAVCWHHREGANTYWECTCDCGNATVVSLSSLVSGNTKSCGCYGREQKRNATTKHNKSHERIYRIWIGMNQRCFNPKNTGYKNYGARGIKVCDEWKEFEPFYVWAMSNGYEDNLTIERNDVNQNYCPENCRWATMKEQGNNRRTNRTITYNGITKTITEWSEEFNLKEHVLTDRISRGWDIEKALTTRVADYSMEILYNGEIMTLTKFSKEIGMSRCAVTTRLKRGFSPEEIAKHKYSIATLVRSPKNRIPPSSDNPA